MNGAHRCAPGETISRHEWRTRATAMRVNRFRHGGICSSAQIARREEYRLQPLPADTNPAHETPELLTRNRRSRRRTLFGQTLGLSAALFTGVGLASAQEVPPSEEPDPGSDPGTDAPPTDAPAEVPVPEPAAPVFPGIEPITSFAYGMQAHLYYQDVPRTVSLVTEAGFGWVKQQVRWSDVEPVRGSPDWSQIDLIVAGANLVGAKILFSVVTAPGWSRSDGKVDGPPDDYAQFGIFLTKLATRYLGKVHAYEVWNEQNFSREWGGGKIDAGKYVELLAIAYAALKAVDPNVVVISGALTPTGFNDPNIAIDDVVYIQQMYDYKNGLIKTVCDAVGAHAGGFNNPPDDTPTKKSVPSTNFKGHPSFYFRRIEGLREIMILRGESEKMMWITEFGWSTLNKAKGYEYGTDVTEADQAKYLTRAIEIGRGYGWVGGMFVWNLNFQIFVPDTDEKWPFGIVRKDYSPRPAYTALKALTKIP